MPQRLLATTIVVTARLQFAQFKIFFNQAMLLWKST